MCVCGGVGGGGGEENNDEIHVTSQIYFFDIDKILS